MRAEGRKKHGGMPPAALASALDAHRRGDLATAEHGYREILARSPSQADALNLLGVLMLQRGSRGEALALLRQAVQSAPGNPAIHNNLGEALRAGGDADGAVAAYRAAVRLEPRHAQAWSNLGAVLHSRGEGAEAVAALQRSLALEPTLADGWNNLGIALQAQGRAGEAISAFESGAHEPSLCGFFFEKFFTASGALRSEFPSRRTGFTALPRTFAYRAWTSFSSSVVATSG